MDKHIKQKSKTRSFEKLTHLPLFSDTSNSNSQVNTHNYSAYSKQNDTTLLKLVQKKHASNLKCCDCNSSKTVDWISINFLCVLCIKCSGVHRSMGVHISKVRSLTWDTFKSTELLYLIKNSVCNETFNKIYEAKLAPSAKITSTVSDIQRSAFINNKYKIKQYVSEQTDYSATIKQIINGIHDETIISLQTALAQSTITLKNLSLQYNKTETSNISLFKYSLKHNIVIDKIPIYHVAEFLISNDIVIDDYPVDDGSCLKYWPKEAITFWRSKLQTFGTLESPSLESLDEDRIAPLPNNKKNKASSIKRWSLSNIPKTSQNIISMHKSLKRNKQKE